VAASEIEPRRHWFFSAASVVLGGLVGLIPAGIGLATFLDPLRRNASSPKGAEQNGAKEGVPNGYVRVAALQALPAGGMPQRFPVISDQHDAWNYSPNQPVGAVFLQRTGESEVRCFNATCPHAGCSVSFNGYAYVCPCHNSSFELNGERRPPDSGRENPSPRDLDGLEVDPQKLAQGEVWVRFQDFYTGKHTKIPKT
jgi:menaquinol-cytochrome c reductase iron-sulfur subunit